jgi:hypothetical protein
MVLCASCQSKTSDKQCSNQALKDIIFCGKHARVKSPRLWADVNNVEQKVVLIQKIWRGVYVRNWMKLAGPGVIKRSICHNDEELVTFDDKKSVHPFDYFAFEENSKVYWFDIRTIFETSICKNSPDNPYTRQKLTIDTRRRLRKLISLRVRAKRDLLHDMNKMISNVDGLMNNWKIVCQILEENGFPDVNPEHFLELREIQYYVFATMMHQDMIAWAAQHVRPGSKRKRYVKWLSHLSGEYMAGADWYELSRLSSKILINLFNDYPDPYEICFMVVSALYRV